MDNVTLNEWPRDTSAAPYSVQPLWTFKEEISFASGLLFKIERLIVQPRPQMLGNVHERHLGVVKYKARERESGRAV